MISLSGPALSFIDRSSALYNTLTGINPRLAAKDATIWGEAAATEAKIRLNWVDLPTSSRSLLPELDRLSSHFPAADEIILCGMGGSSLGPEVISRTYKKKIHIVDSTDPEYLANFLTDDFSRTVIVIGSKSGSTIETASQRSFFIDHLISQGLEPARHIVVVTDPQSPLDQSSRGDGFHVINADPHVGGRFSVLSAFGLVPSHLAGVDVSLLLDSAEETRAQIISSSCAVDVAYLLATQSTQYLGFTDDTSDLPGLSDWIEQLIAESTGKDGVGRLPVVTEDVASAESVGFAITYGEGGDLNVRGDLGSHFIFWEWVTALLGAALSIDPFNQPNVTEAKEQTATLLRDWQGRMPERAKSAALIEIDGLDLQELIAALPDDGYLAIMAYLDRSDDGELAQLRAILAEKTKRPVTFGWGPRFLHSTGQFHKAGQPNGVFLQVSAVTSVDFDIPGVNYSFNTLLQAQREGDRLALQARGYPTTHIFLNKRREGISELLEIARKL